MVTSGDVSVSPYPISIPDACISDPTRFITSTGQGAPAMISVRNEVRSKRANSGWFSSRDEHGRHAVERGNAFGLDGFERRQGIKPRRRQNKRRARDNAREAPRTRSQSSGTWVLARISDPLAVNCIHSPVRIALLTRLWWVSRTPFGEPVVPDVYWMFVTPELDAALAS